jgi:uncharacterized protein YllA (UPF0747 family)
MNFLGWLEEETEQRNGGTEGVMAAATERVVSLADAEIPQGVTPSRILRQQLGGVNFELLCSAARERLRRPGTLSSEAGAEILEWNLACGADPAVGPIWHALLRGEGVSVIAGQQPALLGGPLYTLYKLLTAVAVAGELERSVGCPTLAVFWVVGDDSDFGEVSAAWLPRADGSVRRLRDEAVPPGGTLIGLLSADRQLRALRGLAASSPTENPQSVQWAARERDLLTAVAASGRNWSGFLAALVYRLLPGVRCLFVDGAHPAIVRERPLLRPARSRASLLDCDSQHESPGHP